MCTSIKTLLLTAHNTNLLWPCFDSTKTKLWFCPPRNSKISPTALYFPKKNVCRSMRHNISDLIKMRARSLCVQFLRTDLRTLLANESEVLNNFKITINHDVMCRTSGVAQSGEGEDGRRWRHNVYGHVPIMSLGHKFIRILQSWYVSVVDKYISIYIVIFMYILHANNYIQNH